MPLKLIPPRSGRSPNWTIRGAYLGVSIDRTAGTSKRAVAEQRRRQIEATIEGGQYQQQKCAVTFAAAALTYVQSGRPRRYVMRLAEHFGETPVEAIDQAAIDAAALALRPNGSPAHRNRSVYTPLSAILRAAGSKEKVRRPVGAKGRIRTDHLNPSDALAIIRAAEVIDSEFAVLLRFLLYTGCRIGEALELTWDRLDLSQGTAYIIESKNGDARTVLLRQDLRDALQARREANGRVFRWHTGGWLREMMLHVRLAACGLRAPERHGRKRHVPQHRLSWVKFHTFRHTWATWFRQYGGGDLQGLVATGNWRDPRSAARYAHCCGPGRMGSGREDADAQWKIRGFGIVDSINPL
jgi:integrase